MYEGYLVLGGTEIANATRVAAYVRNLIPGFPLRDCQGCVSIPSVLGEAPYTSPLLDGAEWIDASDPSTYDFLGFYPIEVVGIDSATTRATVVQSIGPGGYNNLPRDATRQIRVRGVMVAKNDLALSAGLSWLREALYPSACGDHGGTCSGSTLCYYAACPELSVCYEEDTHGGTDIAYNNLSQASGLTVLPNTIGRDQRMSGIITPSPLSDGFTFTWGVSNLGTGFDHYLDAPLAVYGRVTPQRTNYVSNPHFTVNTALWGITNGSITRIATGASDGEAYGEVDSTGATVLSTSIGDAPYSPTQLSFELRMPVPGNFTVNIRSGDDSSLVQTQLFSATTDWNIYTLSVPFARGNILEITSTSLDFDITRVLLEGGTIQMPYFDGDHLATMPPTGAINAPIPEYAASWLGVENASPSRMLWLGTATYEFCGEDIYPWITVQGGTGSVLVTWVGSYRVSDEDQGATYERHMHDVACISGPTVTNVLNTSGGSSCVVEFLLSAATPFAYSTPTDLLDRFPLTSLDSQSWVDIATPAVAESIIVDPDCPPIPAPPRPPAITNSCIDGPGLWDRYYYPIPADQIAAWQKMLPKITLYSGTEDLRQVRVRLTPNPFDWPVETGNMVNLSPNPSGEAATTGWVAIPGTSGAATVSNPTSATAFGTKVIRTTWTTASTAFGGGIYQEIPVTAGGVYSFQMGHVKPSVSNLITSQIQWLDVSDAVISTSAGAASVTGAGVVSSRSMLNKTAPALAVKARYGVITAGGVGYVNWAIGDYLEVDGFMANEGETINDYFDGGSADSGEWFYGWTGTEDLSTSVAQQSIIDPYSYCAEFILSYLPADAELTVDGMVSRAWASIAGQAPVTASNLLYGTDGAPITWPEATCGVPYLLTVDVPVGEGDEILMSLSLTRRG